MNHNNPESREDLPYFLMDRTSPIKSNTIAQVTDYLLKRGFTQTERIFRKESADLGPDGRPKHERVDQLGPKKYSKSLILLSNWIDNNLDVYKVILFFTYRLANIS